GTGEGGDEGQATPFPLSHLAARWQGDEGAAIDVRWATAAGWQPWQRLEVWHDMTEGAGGTVFAAWVRADDAVRVDARVIAGHVSDLGLVVIDATHGRRHSIAVSKPAAASAATGPGRDVPQPPVMTRSQWGADESMRKG